MTQRQKKKALAASKQTGKKKIPVDNSVQEIVNHIGTDPEAMLQQVKDYFIVPQPLFKAPFNSEEAEKEFKSKLLSINRLLHGEENRQAEVLNIILAECVAGAYQDRIFVYDLMGSNFEDFETTRRIQRLRHAADNHLLRVLQIFRDIKRPPVNVVVKQADQLNIAQQQQINNEGVDLPGK